MATQFNFNTSPFTFSNSFAPSNPLLEEVPILGQSDFRTPSFGQDNFSFSQFALPGIIGGGAPAIISSGSSLAPSGQVVTSAARGIKDVVRLPQLTLPGATTTASALSRFAGPAALLGLVDLGSRAFTGKGIGEIGGELVGNFFFPGAQSLPAFNNEERQLISNFKLPEEFSLPEENFVNQQPEVEISNLITDNPFNNPLFIPEDRDSDPIRATYQLGPQYNNEIIQERESGELFVPSASQLQFFMDGMEAASQPSATGIGPGGSQGVRFGGGEAPLSVDQTRALLQERFGAPTISAIQALPEGEGLGLRVDAQGRMISPGDDRSAFEQASRDRQDRIALRDLQPGETQTQRDTRLANARTQGSDNVPLDVIEAINTPANRRTSEQIKRISQWESSEQGKAMGGVAGLIRERTQFEPRIVEIDGQRLIQLSPTYFQPIRPEPKEGEKFEPRVITINDFVYVEESANNFKRQPLSNFVSQEDMLNQLSESIGKKLNAKNIISPSTANFQEGEVREQDGIRYRFDGTNWNQL